MKQILTLSLILCITSLYAGAQSSFKLTSNRNYYRSGDKIIKQQVEFKDPGPSGKHITWDFSMLSSINEKYKLIYFNKTKGDTTRVVGHEHETTYRYQLKNDTLWLTDYENRTTRMYFDQAEAQLRFPFRYGDSLRSVFNGKGMYCQKVNLIAKGTTSVTVDAKGDLITPTYDTLRNVIRVKRFRDYSEIGIDSTRLQLITYSWYVQGIRYPVFETIKSFVLRGDSVLEDFGTSFYYPIKDLQSLDPDPSNENLKLENSTDIHSTFTEAQLMPNPVVDDLNINYKLTRSAKVWFTIHNNAGIPLCQTAPENQIEGYQRSTICMSSLITGVYSLYVHVDDKVMRLNVVKR